MMDVNQARSRLSVSVVPTPTVLRTVRSLPIARVGSPTNVPLSSALGGTEADPSGGVATCSLVAASCP